MLFDIPFKKPDQVGDGKLKLAKPENFDDLCFDTSCFAGKNHELVVSGSTNGDIFMWSIPEGPFISSLLDDEDKKPFLIASCHRTGVNLVRYNVHLSALASCSNDKNVPFLTPFSLPYSLQSIQVDSDSSEESEYEDIEYSSFISVSPDRSSLLDFFSEDL